MRIDSSGNLGIGTTTPQSTLTVVNSSNVSTLSIQAGTSQANNNLFETTNSTGASYYFTIASSGTATALSVVPRADNTYTLGASGLRWSNIYAATSTVGDLVFGNEFRMTEDYTPSSQALIFLNQNSREILRLDEYGNLTSSGAIAIGDGAALRFPDGTTQMTAPVVAVAPWTVSGENLSPTSTSYRVGLGTSTPEAKLHVLDATTTQFRLGFDATHYQDFSVDNTGTLSIGTSSSAFAVTSAGQVGIGTTTPQYGLHVSRLTAGAVAGFTDQNATCVIDPTVAGLLCSSDAAKKRDVVQIASALDAVMALRGVSYRWMSEETTISPHTGFIAQEVEQVLPYLVSTDAAGLKSVNYTGFTPLLVEALKELNQRVSLYFPTSSDLALPGQQGISRMLLTAIVDAFRGAYDLVIEKGVLQIARIISDKLTTRELCVGETCVTEEQLKALLENADQRGLDADGRGSGGTSTSTPSTEPTATSTDSTATSTSPGGETETATSTPPDGGQGSEATSTPPEVPPEAVPAPEPTPPAETTDNGQLTTDSAQPTGEPQPPEPTSSENQEPAV